MSRSRWLRLQFPLRLLLGIVTVVCVLLWWLWTRPYQEARRQSAAGHRQIHERDRSYLEFCFDQAVQNSLVTVLGDSRLTHWDHVQWLAAPDDETIISFGSDHALLLWSRSDGSIRRGFYDVAVAAYAEETQEVCFVDEQGQFRVWQLASDSVSDEQCDLSANWHGLIDVTPDGHHVIHFSQQDGVTIWDRKRSVGSTFPIGGWRAAHTFTPDLKYVLIGKPEVIDKYELDTGNLKDAFLAPKSPGGSQAGTYVLKFSPDLEKLIISDADGNLSIYDWPERTLLSQVTGVTELVNSAVFKNDDTLLTAGSEIHEYTAWDTPDVRHRTLLSNRATALWSGDGRVLVGIEHGRILELAGNSPRRLVGGPRNDATAFAFSPDGDRIALAGRDGQLTIRETATWQQVQSWKAHDNWVQWLLWASHDDLLFSQGEDSLIAVWNAKTGSELRTLKSFTTRRPTLSRNGKYLGFYRSGKTGIVIYSIAAWEELVTIPGKALRVRGDYVLSDDATALFAGGSKETVDHWSLKRNEKIASFGGRTLDDVKLALSLDEQQIFATDGRSVEAFDIATGTLLWTVPAHSTLVCDLSGHCSESILATGGKDGTVALIDSSQGKLIKKLRLAPSGGEILQVDFSPDGRLLAAAMSNGAVVVMREPWK